MRCGDERQRAIPALPFHVREACAIALGHPFGATGAILLGTALDELERRNARTALITMCIAGGQGIATILERLA